MTTSTAAGAPGYNGTLHFDGTDLLITRDSLFARSQFGRTETRIPLANITSMTYQPAAKGLRDVVVNRLGARGHVRLTTAGVTHRANPLRDPFTVVFTKTQQAAMRSLLDTIEASR